MYKDKKIAEVVRNAIPCNIYMFKEKKSQKERGKKGVREPPKNPFFLFPFSLNTTRPSTLPCEVRALQLNSCENPMPFNLKRPSLRERLNTVYFQLYTPFVNNALVALSLLLLIVSFWDRSTLSSGWFHYCEGIVTFVFAFEIGLRLLVMRAGFCDSLMNVIEAASCVVCVLMFSVISLAHHNSRMEHNALIALRYSSQLLRLAGMLKKHSSQSVSGADMEIFTAGGHLKIERDVEELV